MVLLLTNFKELNPMDVGFIILGILIVVIIGLFMGESKRYKLAQESKKLAEANQQKESILSHKKEAFLKVLKEASPEEIARLLELSTHPTINIYLNPKVHYELHNAMIQQLVKYLVSENFRLSMTLEDQLLMDDWKCPVLVIEPKRNVFMFHNDQLEDRRASRSFTIETNDLKAVIKDINDSIILMRGVCNG